MSKNFSHKYKLDKRAKRTTLLMSLIVLSLSALLAFLCKDGGYYIVAWFVSVWIFALILLILSMPRAIIFSNHTLEIRCVLNVVEVPQNSIASVRRISRSSLRYYIPLCASHGFLGYFGYYYHLPSRKFATMYASEFSNLVLIECTNGKQLIINCPQPSRLRASLG